MKQQTIWIGIEGIGGVGKSTQLQLLESNLPQLFPNFYFHFEKEYIDNKIGEYLKSNIEDDDFRTKKISNSSSFANHLLVIAYRLDRIRKLLSTNKIDVIILDRFILSDIAHALTDCNININSFEYSILIEAFNSIFYHPNFAKANQILYYFFLDCPINDIIWRLEKRNNIILNESHIKFLINLQKNYRYLISNQQNIIMFNTSKSSNEAQVEIIDATKTIIEKTFNI